MTSSAKKIFFIEDSFEFNANDLNSNKIRGAEKILINLTNEIAKIDNLSVYVFNNSSIDKKINNVRWLNINKIQDHKNPDFLIAWSDANLLSNINSPNKYIWSHSVQPIEKFIRKKQLLAFIKNKPKVILEGDYHFKNRSFFTSLYGKHIIKLAPDYDFLSVEINANNIPSPNAIFTTRSDRNLEYLLDCWNEIIKLSKASNLFVNPPYVLNNRDVKNSVFLRKPSSKENLINELINSRVMLCPGHKGEVYCLAAEEARALCLPIVTMGIGSLYERVEHGKTGFIAKSKKEFINFAVQILTDDNLYMELKKNLINLRFKRNYADVAKDFLDLIFKNN